MSLEERIESNTTALNDLTKAILGKPGGVAGKPAGAVKANGANGAATTPKRTAEEVMAIAVKVKNDISKEAAQFLIAKHGAASLKALKPAAFAAFHADCETALESGEVEGMTDEEDGL